MKNSIVTLIAVVAFLFGANVQAGVISMYNTDEKAAYMELAGASEWAIAGAADFDKQKAPYEWGFDLVNVLDQYRDPGDQVGNKNGSYNIDKYDGMGAGYNHALTGTGEGVGIQFSHNSANSAGISVAEGTVSSFYLNFISTHANQNSTTGFYDIEILDSDGNKHSFKNIAFGEFAGFIFGEGTYLTSFQITTIGNPNTGYVFDFVPGDGTAATPEPATLALLGLGLVGLGAVRARRLNRK